MSVIVNLLGDEKPVFVDPRTGGLGGSFYENPHLQPYAPLPLKWAFEQLIRYERATLLDVGASTGCFSLLSRHHPDLRVWAFEPVVLTYEVLTENIKLNGLEDRVKSFRLGISNYNGVGTLHTIIADGGKGVSMVDGEPSYHKAVENSEIDMVTIDAFCALHGIIPTMIKIDCEGSELQVLQGAVETIKQYHPFILAEYAEENAWQYRYHANEMIPFLEELGYFWTMPESDLLCVHRNWQDIK